ncbi:MAG: hypothetical protein XU14_C0033G0005 [Armatimonadetes bacterium CSP1-3]|nr:MAG: hypothetical protein XU14_C0033G0005 [Armatimonadetes bacterium CSP1-3]
MKTFLQKYLEDIVLFTGGSLVVVGVHQIYPPAALVVAGLMLIGVAILIGKVRANASK